MLSVIIPTLNEEKALPETLATVFEQAAGEEVIVVDGGSTDDTENICKRYPGITFISSEKGRAAQLNAGAKIANGDILLFLHADTLLPANALDTIKEMMRHEQYQAGGFKHSFGDEDWRLKFISFLDNRRCLKTKIIYGDQAMFIKRKLFDRLGGFPEVKIMEDIYFCEKLVKETTPVILDSYARTDPRKFIKMGIWRSLYRVAAIQTRHELKLPVANDHPFFSEIR
ncbi:MAG: TIGR04283 family arsenosugar biosynthesis glycosyltransferase [Gammaproteobacteria bacterium]|nr:TIGR04283 family arsenosugar biosynthesis glycosyltransferase [Gammaproteobacteria bacterium]NNJ49972.1 glycosyltransferase family 2 protein [Gammaproteobacteria bacterium]